MAKDCDDRRLEGVEAYVMASDCERHYLWKDYAKEYGVKWEQESFGYEFSFKSPRVKEEIRICIFFAKVFGHRVAFYYPIGNIVDWAAIEKWIDKRCPKDKDGRLMETNAMNFPNVLRYFLPEGFVFKSYEERFREIKKLCP